MSAAVHDLAAAPAARAPARLIRSDDEAIEVAAALAERFREGSAARDRDRALPIAEIDAFSASGLWGILVPTAFGGAGVSYATLGRVIGLIATADGSLGQLSQNHHFLVEILKWSASPAQQAFFFERVLAGDRFGNALAERGTRTAKSWATRIVPDGGRYRLSGEKYYSTGALFADWVVPSVFDEDDRRAYVFVPRGRAGVEVVDDWNGFGQRTTASGTSRFTDVVVEPELVVPTHSAAGYTLSLPVAHIMHAAIDAGIGRRAYEELLDYVRHSARPWHETGLAAATDDPHTLADVGDLSMRLAAAEALIERAGRVLDVADRSPSETAWAEATAAVFEAKVFAAEVGLSAATKLVEHAGSSATRRDLGNDRYWRDVRTHSVHDPVRWRRHEVGAFRLTGKPPLGYAEASRRYRNPGRPRL
ncbi:SfnB family sulfur acquisition oxidoreductase [Methylobrevis albus]|uniref:SfnB family sulfur acquisition oxidoreductase n=1 Tax=Methylobrevis albus TaxID=2793297 RepID=A0A931I289_9HYPH|nr:SfnB family sulfur acquisition oxidoreductase [Methylobrevis albus]MBH0238920.1 SfnB family sulfur acquisition oxidoreductase [Methylobrevis albus]